jgi:heme/copper-type cytochrome/quinol oxidase subunit 2
MEKILNNKKLLIVGVILLIVFIFLLIIFLIPLKKNQKTANEEKPSSVSEQENMSKVLEELKNIKVPEPSEKIEESSTFQEPEITTSKATSDLKSQPNIAVPQEAIPISRQESGPKLRSFNLTIKDNKIIPREIRVYVNDVVDINIFATDKDYDILIPEYGLKTEVKKGKSAKIQFQAYNPGKFTLLCSLCSPEFKGSLLVKPQ